MAKTKIGVIGLGAMGHEIAKNFIERGYEVLGYRRSAMDAFQEVGGIPAASPREIAESCKTIVTILPDADAMQEVIAGENGILSTGVTDITIIDLSTFRIPEKEDYQKQLADGGCTLIDAPISGFPDMVAARSAVIFVSCTKRQFEESEPVLNAMTDKIYYLGEFGAGSKLKYITNSLVSIHVAAAAEAFAMALEAGMKPDVLLEILPESAASSLQLRARAPKMMAKRYEPAQGSSAMLAKDLFAILEFADGFRSSRTLIEAANDYFQKTLDSPLGDMDCSGVYEIIANEDPSKN